MIDKLVKNYRAEYLNKQAYIFSSSHFSRVSYYRYQDESITRKDIIIKISALDPLLEMPHLSSFVSIIVKYFWK